MQDSWQSIEALVAVRTYPVPSRQSIEVSCTAGITPDGEWVRLYPIPWRLLPEERRFRRYERIQVRARPATSDRRVESRRIDEDSIRILQQPLSTKHQWAARRRIVMPLKAESMCALRAQRDATGSPTLGFVKPKEIRRLVIQPEEHPEWTETELARLRQPDLWRATPDHELEKIPYKFSYVFRCESPGCGSHTMMCTDWEMAEYFRRVRSRLDWEERFRLQFEGMIERCDLHFYVGTVSDHPGSWIIIGLWYPPKIQQGLLAI